LLKKKNPAKIFQETATNTPKREPRDQRVKKIFPKKKNPQRKKSPQE
jgi:hypothetical protein